MALRTFQPDAQEQLADDSCQFVRSSTIAKHRHGTVLEGAALGRQQLMHKLVVRFVLAERIANPMVVIQHGFDSRVVRIRT